jgi:hypothetical protein
MLTFTTEKTISSIERMGAYVAGLSTSTTIAGGTCYLRPLSEVESANNGFQYGVAFNAIFEVDFDVRQQDKITIDGTVYTVKGVATHDRGYNTQYRKALIVKPETA